MVTAAKRRPMRPGWWRIPGAICGEMSRRGGETGECAAYLFTTGWAWDVYVFGKQFASGAAPTEAAAQRKADAALVRAAKRLAKAAGLEVRG